MLIGAINYNLSLGHALIFLLAGLGLVAMVHTFHNLFGLRLTPGRCEAAFAGDLARFPLQLENPRRQLRRALEFSFADQPTVTVDLPPGKGRATIAVPFATQRRGRLDPGRVTLATRYPLGLFRAWSYPYPPFVHRLSETAALAAAAALAGQHADHRRATAARKTSPACGRASSATRPGTSPGKRSPAAPTSSRCWSSSSPAAPSTNSGSTGR
jgi:uncharacterized protein (DUF58 family)